MGLIASWILEFDSLAIPRLFLTQKLLEKSLENIVGHDSGVRIGLTLAMKDGGGRLVDAIGLAQREVLVDRGVKSAALDERANFSHFRGGEHGGDGAIHVAGLFPLLLVLEERLFDRLNLAEL